MLLFKEIHKHLDQESRQYGFVTTIQLQKVGSSTLGGTCDEKVVLGYATTTAITMHCHRCEIDCDNN
ncbi:hypothetical protein DFA_00400 [Cavenderia fasciculata]|uniref:Uncharacterized protein n=1 Tax=Cavenderia fasciculata TaxID=261658 RepID=F4PRP0_CACFS|nr:uncharacterized protein DFA_00400 [Cavenderia fasciculata]EGG20539.1 hypothetical protein DFA_00400 [Cavenderia fasciculata]|eukprot:XP_004358389.1 hypothetical protein DFA_00400 [Cavenderia fasciculata]